MRDRLIELLRKSGASFERALPEEIADYLLANGVIVPPCKVGDKVYWIFEPPFDDVTEKEIVEDEFWWAMFEDFGKTVFLTREEAEKALAERSKG